MKESILQAGWETHALQAGVFTTVCGSEVIIVDPGIPNPGSGPDFECGLIRVDGILWAGNIEMHIEREDFFRHHHEKDPAYSNLLLHVFLKKGRTSKEIPGVAFEICLEQNGAKGNLTTEKPSVLKRLYCGTNAKNVSQVVREKLLKRMILNRFEERNFLIKQILYNHQNDWHLAYLLLSARAFGRGSNSEIFERLTRIMHRREWLKNRYRFDDLKYFLFRHSGLPDNQALLIRDGEKRKKRKYLSAENQSEPLIGSIWKKKSSRPSSEPASMIAAFVLFLPLISEGFHSFIKLTPGLQPIEFMMNILNNDKSTQDAERREKFISKKRQLTLVKSLLINSISPIIYCYGIEMGNISYTKWAIDQLKSMESEYNYITRLFLSSGLKTNDASDSQAILHLYRNYCQKGKCNLCDLSDGK